MVRFEGVRLIANYSYENIVYGFPCYTTEFLSQDAICYNKSLVMWQNFEFPVICHIHTVE